MAKSKKLRTFLIGAGIVAALIGGVKIAKTSMKPRPTFLEQEKISHLRKNPFGKVFDYIESDWEYARFGSFFTHEFNSHEAQDAKSLGIIRYDPNNPKFAVCKSTIHTLGDNPVDPIEMWVTFRDIKTDANSLSGLLNSGILEKILKNPDDPNLLEDIDFIFNESRGKFLSPITTPQNIIGIAYNYQEHASEVGSEAFKGKKMVAFRKESSSLSGPFGVIVKPKEVKLLDYEAELGIVIGKKIDKGSEITKDSYLDYIAGYVLVNDISARDVQLKGGGLLDRTKGFRKGKSYPGFCPVGPVFRYGNPIGPAHMYGKKELDFELNQYLKRDDELYHLQQGNSKNMVNSPYEIIRELQKRLDSDDKKEYRIFIDKNNNRNYALEPGDLIVTGTPAGVAFNFDIKYLIGCGGKQGFIDFEEKNNEKYLRQEDLLITHSKKLGYQIHEIE